MIKPSFFYIIKTRLQKKNYLYEFYFKGRNVLDVGCGEGEMMSFGKNNITGIDMNERAINRLQQEGYKAILASVTSLPFDDDHFEAANCHNVIEHLDVQTAYMLLKETARVLKPGSLLVLSSELPTSKFWNTFGHIKPYPPMAVLKLLRAESREEFEGLADLEFHSVFYSSDCFNYKFVHLIAAFIAYHLPLLRREYFLVLKKKQLT